MHLLADVRRCQEPSQQVFPYSEKLSNPLFESQEESPFSIPEGQACKASVVPVNGPTPTAAYMATSSQSVQAARSQPRTAEEAQAASSRRDVDALLERMQALAQARRALVTQLQVYHREHVCSSVQTVHLKAMLTSIKP